MKEFSFLEKTSIFVGGLAIGAYGIMAALSVRMAQSYPDFVVGNIAWTAQAKVQDLLVAPAFILGTVLFMIFAARTLQRLKAGPQVSSAEDLAEQIVFWSLPLIVVVGARLLAGNIEREVVNFSAMSVLLVTIVCWANAVRENDEQPRESGLIFLSVIFVSLLPVGIALVLNRLYFPVGSGFVTAQVATMTSTLFYLGALLFLVRPFFRALQTRALPPILLLAGQIGISLFYFLLLPAFIQSPNLGIVEYDTSILLAVLVAALFLGSIFSIVRRYLTFTRDQDLSVLISPPALFALLLFVKFVGTAVPSINPDDYHFGELLLGWWSYQGGDIPYIGYLPPHGLLYDLHLLTATVFYDGTAASIAQTDSLFWVFLALAAYFALYRFSGGSIMFAFIVLFCLGGRHAWLMFIPFLCLWFNAPLWRQHARWLAAWGLSVPVIVLAVPPQGTLLVAASGPMAAYHLWQFLAHRRNKIWAPVAGALVVLLGIAVTTPAASMFIAAVRYVVENGPLNQVAYGVPWSVSWTWGVPTGLAFEVIRGSWLVAGVMALGLVYLSLRCAEDRPRRALQALMVALFVLLLTPYSLGRIDGGISRAGLTSIFAWSVLLPLIFWSVIGRQHRALVFLTMVAVNSPLGRMPMSLRALQSHVAQTVQSPPLRDGAAVGMPNIGTAVVDQDHWDRLIRLKRVLDMELADGAPYLDLTSRNAQYFYLERQPVIPVTAVYNMVSLPQQKRAVRILEQNPPEIALLEAENVIHDGGGLALRTPYLYRFVLDNYVPFYRDGFILGRLRNGPNAHSGGDDHVVVRTGDDADWSGGAHRSENAVLVDDPYLVRHVVLGDLFAFWDGQTRSVAAVSSKASVIWFEQSLPRDLPVPEERTLRWLGDLGAIAAYRRDLAQRAFAAPNFGLIPVAWGGSIDTLKDRMDEVLDLGSVPVTVNDVNPSSDGRYEVTGPDPHIVFDLATTGLSGRAADLLSFDLSCTDPAGVPQMQIFWWGDGMPNPVEDYSIGFIGSDNTVIIPLDALPKWRALGSIMGLRIDFNYSVACPAIQFGNAALHARSFD